MAPPALLTRMSMRPSSLATPLDGVSRLLLLRQIGLDPDTPTSERLDFLHHARRRQCFAISRSDTKIDIDDRDIAAQQRQPQRIGTTDTAGAAGDDRNLAS